MATLRGGSKAHYFFEFSQSRNLEKASVALPALDMFRAGRWLESTLL
jgi:hypothetical protein